jgi:oxygen-independent coproporphyrinogen-3 oxidase
MPLEFMMNALRLNDGVPMPYFSERTGVEWSVLQPYWESLTQQGLVEVKNNYARPTVLGRRFLNRVLQAFINEEV